jgi:hypothetical protein
LFHDYSSKRMRYEDERTLLLLLKHQWLSAAALCCGMSWDLH